VIRSGGVPSLLQVTDLKAARSPTKNDLRVTIKQVVNLFQEIRGIARNVSSDFVPVLLKLLLTM
jgi:hypothetical protein